MTTTATHIDDGSGDTVTIIQIDYEPSTEDPGRIFRSMAKLIEAFHHIDQDLARAYSVTIEPIVLLERIEAGSLRTVLRNVLRQMDDDALKNLDWKPLVGQYLVSGKHLLLRWLDGKDAIAGRELLTGLQSDLAQLVPQGEPGTLHLPAVIPQSRLLEDIKELADAQVDLQPTDRATFFGGGEKTSIPPGLGITSEDIDRLLTEETLVSDSELTLLVKKPDYLGNSRWELKHNEHFIEAKMLDDAWLARFHDGTIVLRPGDSLRARFRAEVNRGFEGNLVSARYFVLEVKGIVRDIEGDQFPLLRVT